jgi:hypothetical protein
VERSAEYRRALSELHSLETSFQSGLDRAQRERWLVLEEALLAHSERLSRAYFHAGFHCGVEWNARSRASRRQRGRSPFPVEAGLTPSTALGAATGSAAVLGSAATTPGSGRAPVAARSAPAVAGAQAAGAIRAEAEAAVSAGADCVAALARLLLAIVKR